MKNILGDVLQRPDLANATLALMDINPVRLGESETVARKIVKTLGVGATIETHDNQRRALENADFVVVTFQIGGYEPCTVTDFEIPKKYNLRQTIADTLGPGGIMRGLRTVPHLWAICEDMLAVCPDALMLQYVNPMAINTWAMAAKYPSIKQVGLCHSVQGTAAELAHDLDIPIDTMRYQSAGINHMAFYTRLEQRMPDGTYRDLYPDLRAGYAEGRLPKENRHNPRCPNIVRYEMMMRLGYFVTESSEHFAEYVPWFIKAGREDLVKRYEVALDEYPARCIEQIANWKAQAEEYASAERIEVQQSSEYASDIINSKWTGTPSVVYGNVRNDGCISSLPADAAVEVPCLVDANGIQPVRVGKLPVQLTALIRTNLSVQELVVQALMTRSIEHVYHAVMMDPHTSAELDLDQIWALTDDLLAAHGDWMPDWARATRSQAAE